MNAPFSKICGFQVFAGSTAEFIEVVRGLVQENRGTRILTLNLEMVSLAKRNKDYPGLARSADLIVADGMPIVWASRWKRGAARIAERTTGSDTTVHLLTLCAPERIAVIGGENPRLGLEKVSPELAEKAYVFDGKVSLEPSQMTAIAEELRVHNSQIVFIALGVPKQDHVAAMLQPLLPDAIFIGVGGTFELISGQKKRAPKWLRVSGLEWVFRLLSEPRRLGRRYLIGYWPGVFALVGDILRPNRVKP
jgi:N-acetylglucosaminyldiphosphoundecaprenol N-acetyl-beta-D-mannosaminyltransferase